MRAATSRGCTFCCAPVHPLTTIRQPLRRMGELAAETLLKRIRSAEYHKVIAVEPELIVRESTTAPPADTLEDLGTRSVQAEKA